MKLEQVKQAIEETPKGSNIIIEWTRQGKTRKDVSDAITKSVRMVGRIGIEYDNMKAVQEKRENGELPKENQGLPWGKFEIYPYLIEHKDKRYVRLYNGTSDLVKPKVEWFKNGLAVTRDEIAPLLLASELKSSEGDCFTVPVETITRLHNENTMQGKTEQGKTATTTFTELQPA